MKRLKIFLILSILYFLASCGFKQRENALNEKEANLKQKEQQLMLWEKDLQLKEDSIKLLIARSDSVLFIDSIAMLPSHLQGDWTAKMICIQTNCTGSAIGDVQNDNWQVSAQDSSVIIKSISKDGTINRVYTGNYYQGNTIRASVSNDNPASGKRLVEITGIGQNKMQGTRTVIQSDGCQIVYSLEMDKKQ